jgi:hypothetical protein
MTKKICSTLALLAASCSVPVFADSNSFDSPVATVIPPSACSSQAIAFQGTVHFTQNIVQNKNSLHMTIHGNTQGVKGTGLTDGSNYILVDGTNLEMNSNAGAPLVMDINVDMGVIGQGAAPNFRIRFLLHTTTDANGDMTAQFVKASTVCQ